MPGFINTSMVNYWLKRANQIIEREILLVKNNMDTKRIFDEMPGKLPVIFTYSPKAPAEDDYLGKIGICHNIRMCRLGIEGVLKTAKKYHRYPLFILHNLRLSRDNPFWVVIYDGSM